MLVYVNNFNCIGDNSFFDVSGSVIGWIKRVSGIHLSMDDIYSGRDFYVDRAYVRTYAADRSEPKTYSIMYTHPDNKVGGRQWITEIGISRESNSTFISILLEISDVSTVVDSRPIATRPSLVSFLKKNCEFDHDTVGQKVTFIKNEYGDYQYLLHEIYRDDRNYPLVFVSEKNGVFPTESKKLQEQLFGLAKVISTKGDIDSWEMERLLGRQCSSWGGAINIIYPVNTSGEVGTRLILPDQIDEIKSSSTPINNHLLSIITHGTNGFKKKKHISPVVTRAKRLADDNRVFRDRISNIKNNSDYEELLNEALKEMDDIKLLSDEKELSYLYQIDVVENSLDEMKGKNSFLASEVDRLNAERVSFINSISHVNNAELDVGALVSLVSNKLNPSAILSILEIIIPNNIVILKSAYTSAKRSSGFKHSQKLLFLLYKLSTEYLSTFLDKGDNEAKSVLGAAYSANESETVERSKQLSDMRTFDYMGEKIRMFKHVGIGVAHNKTETIRVHFYIDPECQKVVIGYCGEHLPVQSS